MFIRIGCSAASLRDPADSAEVVIDFEEALYCDGSECCPLVVFPEDGELELLNPHWHMIVKGKSPEAGPRCYPIWANDRMDEAAR
jgi:hypothetical protein